MCKKKVFHALYAKKEQQIPFDGEKARLWLTDNFFLPLMQARLICAVENNNVPKLKRLRQAGVVTPREYRTALICAIKHKSVVAAIYLCANVSDVFEKEDCNGLDRLVLGARDSQWILQLARQAPKYLVWACESSMDESSNVLMRDLAVHHNLLVLTRCNRIRLHANVRARLIETLLLATMSVSSREHTWQGVYSTVCNLMDTEGLVISENHILAACGAMNRQLRGVEERSTLQLLLERSRQVDEDKILRAYCNTVVDEEEVLQVLFAHFQTNNTDGSYARLVASRGSCNVVEVCLDRVPTIGTELSDSLLVIMAQNYRNTYGTRSLAHILDRLLVNASESAVRCALDTINQLRSRFAYSRFESPHDMRRFLIEHLCGRNGWTPNDLHDLCLNEFRWMIQRNSAVFHKLLPRMTDNHARWAQDFFTRQAPIHTALLTHTTLAIDLVNLVMQYA
jgi:hypothetical protein